MAYEHATVEFNLCTRTVIATAKVYIEKYSHNYQSCNYVDEIISITIDGRDVSVDRIRRMAPELYDRIEDEIYNIL
jgi:hypothetical protein